MGYSVELIEYVCGENEKSVQRLELFLDASGWPTHFVMTIVEGDMKAGAATLTIVALLLQASDSAAPGRVLQGIVAGVGFIGAGVILHRQGVRGGVEGLTTAAAIWIVAAVGVAAAAGLWRTATSVVGVVLVLLVAGERVDRWLHRDPPKS
jgi:uncharacterized membrane protein YhiD involved in acid resistance